MLQFSNLTVETAVANYGGAMGAETISTNGRSSKSQMSRIRLLVIMTSATLALSSCASWQKTGSARTANVTHTGIIHKPLVADLSVEPTKVNGSATGNSKYLQSIKNEAIMNALSTAGNADILVEPNFTISTRKKVAKVDVTGYPARYKNFRMLEDSDATWLDIRVYDTMEKQTSIFQRRGFFK